MARVVGPHREYAMTLEEIAKREGVTKEAIRVRLESGLNKLRKMPGAIEAMRDLAIEMRRNQQESHGLSAGGNESWQ